ncbi:hypothetical protein [Desulfosporosinus lacus]|uniref:Uncharacterized protein n=1 Tax=Desulfosporosinus lacus DSM 15449 TaxID=1121420 RepID=A0A1M5ZS00_9FIRM|nr:hypothetical protein [Desulfosporosinus lacus]SHI27077.1 hypothetical protein SAMN02746098_03611 [Desulfosporosinus lacus DSM 15449]
MKKLALTFLFVAVMLFGSSPVLASPESSVSNPIDGGSGIEALQLIQGGYSSIQNAGNNQVSIYGETLTYKVTDIVGVKFHLQYNNNGSWVTLDTVSREGYDTNLFTTMVGYTVSPGYTYRVATEHYAYDGSFKETAWTYTSGVYMP